MDTQFGRQPRWFQAFLLLGALGGMLSMVMVFFLSQPEGEKPFAPLIMQLPFPVVSVDQAAGTVTLHPYIENSSDEVVVAPFTISFINVNTGEVFVLIPEGEGQPELRMLPNEILNQDSVVAFPPDGLPPGRYIVRGTIRAEERQEGSACPTLTPRPGPSPDEEVTVTNAPRCVRRAQSLTYESQGFDVQ